MATNHVATPPPRRRPSRIARIARKLSFRLIVVLAIMAFLIGGGGAYLATQVPAGVAKDVVAAIAEALMVTGATTFLVVFAFSTRIEVSAAVKDALQEDCEPRFDELLTAVADLVSSTQLLANAEVLPRSHIYRKSITLLQDLDEGDIHILMGADEDLTDGTSDPERVTGEDWLTALRGWLDANPTRRLHRVIAARPGVPSDATQIRGPLLDRFEGSGRVDQWAYADTEFSVSVMLLGTHKALFGFLPRPVEKVGPRVRLASNARFEQAVVITSKLLVDFLKNWFDDRYMNPDLSIKIMHHGIVKEEALAELEQQLDVSVTVDDTQ